MKKYIQIPLFSLLLLAGCNGLLFSPEEWSSSKYSFSGEGWECSHCQQVNSVLDTNCFKCHRSFSKKRTWFCTSCKATFNHPDNKRCSSCFSPAPMSSRLEQRALSTFFKETQTLIQEEKLFFGLLPLINACYPDRHWICTQCKHYNDQDACDVCKASQHSNNPTQEREAFLQSLQTLIAWLEQGGLAASSPRFNSDTTWICRSCSYFNVDQENRCRYCNMPHQQLRSVQAAEFMKYATRVNSFLLNNIRHLKTLGQELGVIHEGLSNILGHGPNWTILASRLLHINLAQLIINYRAQGDEYLNTLAQCIPLVVEDIENSIFLKNLNKVVDTFNEKLYTPLDLERFKATPLDLKKFKDKQGIEPEDRLTCSVCYEDCDKKGCDEIVLFKYCPANNKDCDNESSRLRCEACCIQNFRAPKEISIVSSGTAIPYLVSSEARCDICRFPFQNAIRVDEKANENSEGSYYKFYSRNKLAEIMDRYWPR